jgi:hypothetical protein
MKKSIIILLIFISFSSYPNQVKKVYSEKIVYYKYFGMKYFIKKKIEIVEFENIRKILIHDRVEIYRKIGQGIHVNGFFLIFFNKNQFYFLMNSNRDFKTDCTLFNHQEAEISEMFESMTVEKRIIDGFIILDFLSNFNLETKYIFTLKWRTDD